MKKYVLTLSLFGCLLSISAQTDSIVFTFTGTPENFTVPNCVSNITVKLFGAQGGNGGGASGGIGGNGSFVQGNLSVAPGQSFVITVAGGGLGNTAGFGGGGAGGNAGPNGQGGGGGGATSITNISGIVAIAGGGGGGGGIGCVTGVAGGNGGAGGGGNGLNGVGAPTSGGIAGGGFGAIGSAAGLKGDGCIDFLGTDGVAGVSLQGGAGGAGATCCCFTSHTDPSGGGGGGGFVGGGGGGAGSAGTVGCSGNDKGAGGGGAGGSSFTSAAVTNVSIQNGVQTSNGKLVIVFTTTTLVMPTSIPNTICDNLVAFTLPQGTPSGGTWSGNGITNNVFNPAAAIAGNNTLTYTFTGNGCNLSDTTSINVLPCSNIDEAESLKFALFPNPVNHEFTIQANEGSQIETIHVIDVNGEIIFSARPNKQSVQIDTYTWASGIYYVKINNIVKTLIKN